MTETMRAVIKAAPEPGLTLARYPIPSPGPGEILVKVKAASICGTDLHIYRWDPWAQGRIHPPLIIGHEFCGEVVELGPEVDGIRIGDFISAESHVVCGRCDMCRTGKGHLCRNTRILGVDRDGAFADFIVIPAENAWVNPPDLPLEVAVLLENFGNAVHTAFAVDLRARKVLVTGCGPVGLMTIAVARALGARMVIATDISPYRLALARRMGADHVLNPQEVNIVEAIQDLAGGEVDVLLEMSGAPSAIREGFAVLKPGGQAALLGLPPGPIEFDLSNLVIFKGVTIHGIVGRRLWETWYEIRGLLNSGAVDLRPVVTHRFRLEEFDQAFATMASGQSGKVMLIP